MAISDQELEEALGIAAKVINLYGYTYWPIFERLEAELEARQSRRVRILARLPESVGDIRDCTKSKNSTH